MSVVSLIKKLLAEKKATLSVAESCTGWLISSYLTDISGASDFIEQNFVTYSNSSKTELLGVSPKTIEKYGVTSEQVVLEMAKGLINKYKSTFALSTTGILGPTGGSREKPVGMVWIGLANSKCCKAFKYQSKEKTRIKIKKDIAKYALAVLVDFIIKNG
jgi:PncC family amidohydrolase